MEIREENSDYHLAAFPSPRRCSDSEGGTEPTLVLIFHHNILIKPRVSTDNAASYKMRSETESYIRKGVFSCAGTKLLNVSRWRT